MIITILLTIILPIFALIGIGMLVDRKFHLDLPTLSKLNFYVFVPALAFVKLLQSDVTPAMLGQVGLFSLLHGAVLFALAWAVYSYPALRPQRTIISLASIFSNVGNYGIPLILLAFGDKQVGIITIIVVVQNLLSFTFGIWMLERRTQTPLKVLRGMAGVPVVYAVLAAVVLLLCHVQVPEPIMKPLSFLADGLIPVALLMLGAQLSRTRLSQGLPNLMAISSLRLLISPALAVVLLPLFPFTAPVTAVLIIASAFPVAVNVYILAAQYQQDEAMVSQAIFWTTLLSAATMSILLVMVR
jgi:predicted permease